MRQPIRFGRRFSRRPRAAFVAVGWNREDIRTRFIIGSYPTFEEALDACEAWVLEHCAFHTVDQHRQELRNHFGYRTAIIDRRQDPRP